MNWNQHVGVLDIVLRRQSQHENHPPILTDYWPPLLPKIGDLDRLAGFL